MFECKLCKKKIQDGGLEGHHFSKHRTVPFDIGNFREDKPDQCVDQNESVKVSTNEEPAWTVLNPFNCQNCGVRSIRRCNNSRFNSLSHTDPSGENICETCTEEQLKIQALEKQLSEMKALQEKRLEMKRWEEKRLEEKRLEEKQQREKLKKEMQLKMELLKKQPLEKKYSLNLALVNKETIKYYQCKVCHRGGITQDQLYEHPSMYHGLLSTTLQNAFELYAVKVCGQCSDCGQHVNEKQFAEHLQQTHRHALIPTNSDKSKVRDKNC